MSMLFDETILFDSVENEVEKNLDLLLRHMPSFSYFFFVCSVWSLNVEKVLS